jgi:HEXXH motif-containing protein
VSLDDSAYNCFASPLVALNEPFLEMVVINHARLTVEAFLSRNSDQLECLGGGLVSVLTGWLSCDETFATVWDASFGQVYASLLQNDKDNVAQCAAALALHLHECGYPGEWELHANVPVRFRFGRWLLPPAEAVRVCASEHRISISICSRGVWGDYTFQRGEEDWEGADVCALPVLSEDNIRLRIFNCGNITSAGTWLIERLGFAELYKSKEDETTAAVQVVSVCRAAIDFIRAGSDSYLPWVTRVLRDLILLPPSPGITHSGSDKASPGAICLSEVNDRCAVGEMLVHEATHQYFHILNRLGPVDDGTDSTLYFSPFKNADRPIAFILIAYHAFGNVLLFYKKARTRVLAATENRYIDLRIQLLEQQLDTLEDALRRTKALTPLGRALWKPLYEQIHSYLN